MIGRAAVLAIGWWALSPIAAAQAVSSSGDVDYVLQPESYRFCHVAGVDEDELDRYCDLLDGAPKDWCPGMRRTCRGGVTAVPTSAGCGSGGVGGEGAFERLGSPKGSGEKEAERPSGCDPGEAPACEGPAPADADLWSVIRWASAFGVALLVLLVIRVLVATFGRRRAQPEPDVLVTDIVPSLEDMFDDVPNVPSLDLLGRAQRALDQGDSEGALLFARAACLRGLAERGQLRLHRSRTDREYVRSVREDPDLRTRLREVLGEVESMRWGGRPVGVDRASSLLGLVKRILASGLVAMAVWGPSPAEAQSDRFGPEGDSGLFELMERYGHHTSWHQGSLTELSEGTDILVLDTTAVNVQDEEWAALAVWVSQGNVLWVAGDVPERGPLWEGFGVRLPMTGVTETRALDAVPGRLPVPQAPSDTWVWTGGTDVVDLVWVYGDGGVGPVVSQSAHGNGVVVAIADPGMLWNAAWVSPHNTGFWGDLPHVGSSVLGWQRQAQAHIAFVGVETATGASPAESMVQSNLWVFLVQLLVFWGLLIAVAGRPFAPLRGDPGGGRQAFEDHVRALGSRWWRSGASATSASAMARLWAARLGQDGLVRAARAAGRDEAHARAFAESVMERANEDAPRDGEHDWKFEEELWTITRNR